MYTITAIDRVVSDKWGDMIVHKNMKVTSDRKSIYGFIIQHVRKMTTASVLTSRGFKKIKDIDEFTSNRVKHMNGSYYELFPVVDGVATETDSFANGAVLHYEQHKSKWYANNNPPTIGSILQTGSCFFIPATEDEVQSVIAFMKKNARMRNPREMQVAGITWYISVTSPANGLLYTDNIETLFSLKESNILVHVVIAQWDFSKNYNFFNSTRKNNNKNKNNNASTYNALAESNENSNRRDGTTIVSSTFTSMT